MSKDHFRQTDQDNASKNCYGIKRRDVLLSGGDPRPSYAAAAAADPETSDIIPAS
ncbi:MAG: hypothetical protein WA624_06090 [Methylocella sp.]